MTDPTRREFLIQTAGALTVLAIVPEPAWPAPLTGGRITNVAVIGIGRQGRDILDELARIEAVNVAAVCDVVESRATAGADRAAGATTYTDYRRMLETETGVEAVIIATPTHTHAQIALDAMGAGRHVFCEAPLASTVADCRAIAQAAASASTVFATGLQARSNPLYARARSLVRSGSLRTLISFNARDHQRTSWRFPAPDPALDAAFNWRLDPALSTGLAGELGTHQFDVFNWFRGRLPVRVSGSGEVRVHDDGRSVADTVRAHLAWDDGVTLDYSATLGSSYGGRFEELFGSNASIRLGWRNGWLFKEADAPTEGWEVYATRQQFHDDEGIVLVADATRLAAQGRLADGVALENSPLYYALADFIRAVAEGSAPACDAADGAASSILGILTAQAVSTGSPVDVPT